GVRLRVNGLLVIDQLGNASLNKFSSAGIPLAAGKTYDIQIDYVHASGASQLKLAWASDLLAEAAVPTAMLLPASPAGSGLTGRYYDNSDFTSLKAQVTDPLLSFNWGTSAPNPSMAPD